jgi:glycosyltransferase involved in cell wall biosynthesis
MPQPSLHIAWLGAGPRSKETGGVPGVATDLLYGLTELGHRVDCMFTGREHELPERLMGRENLTFVWSGTSWRWGGWYNRTRVGPFVTGLLARGLASLRLRREVARRHREDPYDVVYQFNNIETLSLPASVRRSVPLVIHPEVHMRGELRFLIRERRLALRSQPAYELVVAVVVTWLRSLVQHTLIRRAQLLVCISSVFRDHLVRDYGVAPERTVVVPNPVRLSRFEDVDLDRDMQRPPAILVLSRVAVRKGVEEVIEVARLLHERGPAVRIRVIGRASLWSNYIPLLDALPENAEFVGALPPDEVPGELARSDVLLQASWYEPFGLTVAEALAAGVPVVATSEVGAIEGVDASVGAVTAPGDVAGMFAEVRSMLERLESSPSQMRRCAREEAERLFAREQVCARISAELLALVAASARA